MYKVVYAKMSSKKIKKLCIMIILYANNTTVRLIFRLNYKGLFCIEFS